MADIWMPQAMRADLGDHAPCDPGFPPKAVAHITADREATAAAPQDLLPFDSLQNFFTHAGKDKAPHLLWNPFTGQFAQFFPATSRSKALRDLTGGTRTNRAGKVVIQIEALFFPHCRVNGQVFTALAETPCKGWAELHAWVRSWGVPDTWPMGPPTDFTVHHSASIWQSRGGWYAHAHVPENDHVDPGSWPLFTRQAAATEPFPGPDFFHTGQRSPVIAAMHGRLIAEGCDRYPPGDRIDVWESGDVMSYAAWQEKAGLSGADADGIPGETSWDRLRVPHPV
ncbi:hypothetical protein HEK616_27130 [Streptomyces nigrescens]|uniref:Endolysin n=2 Tax=Streptomyces TaxID=1883 RepID=A0ABM7ZSZ0_STRNI|nr:hypothetical protein HEK616_27130 [Streptomyces nigrescens]